MTITKLGRYDIVRVLGKGAMGLVYEARDPNLDRRVAIKTIKVENLSAEASADYEARFRTEARSAARLQHPNIVSVYDSERHGDTAYLVMEYVQGDDLKQHLDGGKRYTLDESLGMVRDLLAALDYAHRQNIVHRDVKPANLLVEASGRVKLTDFGVARIQDSGEATRTKGSMVGTLKYMSPEQVQGLSVDARADLFAAGIVLYQLLTGRRPFDGEGEFAIIHQIVSQDPPPPSSINPQLPPALDAVVARALAKQRDDRYASAHEFAVALQEASGQVPDPTIVPPFSSSEFRGTGGTGSGVQRSRTGTGFGSAARAGEGSGTTVTQELELVYWKDIKDTDDPADLRGFLDRFPEGIYADLARRRLRKLNGDSGDTSMTRTRVAPAAAPDAAVDEATVLAPRPEDATLVTPRAAAPEAAAHVPPDATDEATLVAAAPVAPAQAPLPEQETPAEPVAAPPIAAREAPPAPPPVDRPPSASPTGPARKSRLVPVLAGLVVAAGAVWLLLPGRTPSSTEAAPPASAASAPVEAAATAAPVASEPTASTASAPGAVAVRAPASTASAAATARAKGTTPAKGVASAPLASSPAAPVATPAPVTAAPPPAAPAPAAAQRPPAARPASESKPADAGSPAAACEGRTLFSLQTCMNEQCAKPAFARHPVCVERAAADRAARGKQGADNR